MRIAWLKGTGLLVLWLLLSACGPAGPASAQPVDTATPAAPTATAPAATATPSVPAPTPLPPTPTPTLAVTGRGMPFLLPNVAARSTGTVTAPPAATPAQVGGEPVRLVIPAIHVDSRVIPVGWTTVYEDGQFFAEWDTADFAVGFHKTSALPGTTGNTVMSGHNNINGEVFRYLDQLKLKDQITVYTADRRSFTYAVTQTMIVPDKYASLEQRLANAAWIGTTTDTRLTLTACWPYTNNTHRVIIVAKPS